MNSILQKPSVAGRPQSWPGGGRDGRPELLNPASVLAARAASGESKKFTLVAGLGSQDGAKDVLTGLGWTLRAQYGLRVLAIELDFHDSDFVSRFHLNPNLTLAAALNESCYLNDSAQVLDDGFSIMPAGRGEAASASAAALIRRIKAEVAPRFDLALVAAPPLSRCSDWLAFAPEVSQMLLVVEAGRWTAQDFEGVTARALEADLEVLGAILTHRKRVLPSWLLRHNRK